MKSTSLIVLYFFASAALLFAEPPLKPGESVEIRLAGVPLEFQGEMTSVYPIDEQGMVNLPFLGQTKIGGMVAAQAAAMIETGLVQSKIYTHPTITVSIREGTRSLNVSGRVKAPGRVVWQVDMTLLTAVNSAGGPDDYAADKVWLTREGKRTIYSRKDLTKHPEKDPKVQPGDQIEVKASWF
jgi:polysaccharide biosynthesis/export protein